ncbi:bifunctional riboflavin kinase/FAD synthetase [Aliterella atlantica]|uniref:Riboflavin biosynthesis protein n=1 Tax=Aliterella atlantica CENA595 TaxID=1618023 RepID=A0A0D8ZZF0_9CYAN|nr:bifunctional riboflavin kinase/FAD synthetase [Aliterella atlantica]KJH72601.1 riboflavin kinase [Aliterella atlantica CENA595]
MWVTSSLTKALTPTAVALGNFDGVHRGHQQVIAPVLAKKRQATQDLHSTVVTFSPHPQEFFTGKRRSLLTPIDQKVEQLERLGIEQLVLLLFDRELACLSPQEFVEQILIQQLQAQSISVGQDFCFGKQRSGKATDLQAIAANYNIPVTIVPLHTCEGDRISSSAIRQALEQGDVQRANLLLGRAYTLAGTVVTGKQIGRTIGFPTANLQLPPENFIPRQGVYAVRVVGVDNSPVAGVMNIGNRPTVSGMSQSVEIHLLDWSGDLYGKAIAVQLEKFIRPEQKFASLEELKAQIQADCEFAKSILESL